MKKLILIVPLALICFCASAQKLSKNANGMEDVSLDIMTSLSDNADRIPKGAVYADPAASPEARAMDVVRRLSFEEKLCLTAGWNRFLIPGIERLGLRPVSMADASQGVRTQTAIIKTPSVSFPCMLALASSWDTELAEEFGRNMGEQCRAYGVDLLLGPTINIQRLSTAGRNYENFGEDPILTGRISSSYIGGLQSRGVIAVPKHFICNDQEFCRHIVDYKVEERALREIYLLPWEIAVKEKHLLGLMTGNNQINGLACSLNRNYLQKIMRDEYGFTGIAMTDWQSTNYQTGLQHLFLTSGESLLMPENNAFREYLNDCKYDKDRMTDIEVLLERLAFINLRTLFEAGVYDRPFHLEENFEKFPEHDAFAAKAATESIVLLKNEDGILPVPAGKKILMMGVEEMHCGKGSGFVVGYDHVSFEQGLKKVYGDNFECKVKPSDDEIAAAEVVLFRLTKECGEGFDVPFEDPMDQLEELERVSKLNKNVIVLISAGNAMPMKNWVDNVKGILWCNYLGQKRGVGLANIISGAVSPSGKLPFTIERSFTDSVDPNYNYLGGMPFWMGNNQYKEYWIHGNMDKKIPGFSEYVKPHETIRIPYLEGVYVGYRWFDKTRKNVMFPFGYGLSYTRFRYCGIECYNNYAQDGTIEVKVRVRNSGTMKAKAVIELYVSPVSSKVSRPQKELKAFSKVELEPAESKVVTFILTERDFAYWGENGWTVEPGRYKIKVGPSSDDFPLVSDIRISK